MEKLYLGVARKVITPEVGGNLYGYYPDLYSTSVADDLTVEAYYFRQGAVQALMVSATVCAIADDTCDELRAVIQEKFGIPAESCMLSAIHTHSGPCLTGGTGWGGRDVAYVENIFIPGLLAAVEDAVADPVPVTVGVAEGNSLVGINRRQLNLENRVILGQNPWGPFNPRMTVMDFKDEAGQSVATMVHYGCHATAAGHNHEISRDWPGPMIDALEAQTGGMVSFFNGPEGDVGPRLTNGKTVGNDSMDYVYELGEVAAADAKRIYSQITQYTTPELKVTSGRCEIPLRPRISRAEAEAIYEENKDRTKNMKALMKATAEKVMAAWDAGEPQQESMGFQQTIIAIGDRAFTAFPYELFSEIGMRIDGGVTDKSVLPVINANGSRAYFVTQDTICRGGYEINQFLYRNMQAYCENADFALIKAVLKNLSEVADVPLYVTPPQLEE